MKRQDPVKHYLTDRGVRADLIDGGLPGLVRRWTAIADEVARGYGLTLDDYRNDMDIRDIIAGAIAVAGSKQRHEIATALEHADRRLRDATVECASLWDDTNFEGAVGDQRERWWYLRKPRRAGSALTADLERPS